VSLPSEQDQLIEFLASTSNDPLAFVLGAFPWGEPGPLANATGPEKWQRQVLEDVRDGLLDLTAAIQIAVASGHGVGKSGLSSWLILWAISTMPDTRGVVTANTENQLKTKTWAELAKWHRLCLARDLFEMTATAIYSRDPAHERTWRIDMTPWSEHNTEAFAGLHNAGRRILVIFDEASAIPDVIHETTEGALTDQDTQILWFMFGNPTRNTGRFREAFRSLSHRWHTHRVDSRTVSFTNKDQIARWIDDYGEDSDFVRIRILGEFPRVSSTQFISTDLAEMAARREDIQAGRYEPLILGVDVARFGDDASRIVFRRGRDARSIPSLERRGLDTMQLATFVAELVAQYKPTAIFIDEGGVGGGVVDRLRQLRISCIGVQFGSRADRPLAPDGAPLGVVRFANKRAEMYGHMRHWLARGAIENDQRLVMELTATEYTLNLRDEIQLERKADLKKRLPSIGSPDWADALALTFAFPVAPLTDAEHPSGPALAHEYNPFEGLAA